MEAFKTAPDVFHEFQIEQRVGREQRWLHSSHDGIEVSSFNELTIKIELCPNHGRVHCFLRLEKSRMPPREGTMRTTGHEKWNG